MNINNYVPNSKIFDNMNLGSGFSISNDNTNQDSTSFLDLLKSKLDEVNTQQLKSEDVTQQFIQGDNVDISQVMLSGEEAKMSLDMAVQVRNKILDAYQELNKTQL